MKTKIHCWRTPERCSIILAAYQKYFVTRWLKLVAVDQVGLIKCWFNYEVIVNTQMGNGLIIWISSSAADILGTFPRVHDPDYGNGSRASIRSQQTSIGILPIRADTYLLPSAHWGTWRPRWFVVFPRLRSQSARSCAHYN